MKPIHTEFKFTLPIGYRDEQANLHREGVMRMANAGDEILPLRDPRVLRNPAYLKIMTLSRVVLRLGSIDTITPAIIDHLFSADLRYLQEFYDKVNQIDEA